MEWLISLARIAGTSTPLTAWLVQIQAEVDAKDIRRRLTTLEDPISALHPDIRAVSAHIYQSMKATGDTFIEFSDADRERYSRALATLEANGLIHERRAIGSPRFSLGIFVTNASYVLYLAAQFEDDVEMAKLFSTVDDAKPPAQLVGQELASWISVPVPVIDAIFETFAERGFGITSAEMGASRYIPTV